MQRPLIHRILGAVLGFLAIFSSGPGATAADKMLLIPKWSVFETSFESRVTYRNPFQEAGLSVVFTSPSGETRIVYGFWDGGSVWRVRFSPNEIGKWIYSTTCEDAANNGLHHREGSFVCTAALGKTVFEKHGPVYVSENRRFLSHEDGTPFFWLADTAWNGALLSTAEEWNSYARERARQKFSAVQWVTTQWRAAPAGDIQKQLAYTGLEKITVNPGFFRRLDEKARTLNQAGLLNVPVLLWAIGGGSNPQVNPGFALAEDQAIRLARYMVARWGAYHVIWILAGDGDYRGLKSERWANIGRGVFDDIHHAPTMMHPGGMHWIYQEFRNEGWLDLFGYQSGHGDDEKTLRWMTKGPPSTDWKYQPIRPFINLEPPYEDHIAYQSKTRILPETTRRAMYWSLLGAPTAGVSYGGHGVWGWDDGTKPPTDHPSTGVPKPWRKALKLPGAEQISHLAAFFTGIDFWQLRPAPQILATQPGESSAAQFSSVSRTDDGAVVAAYLPDNREVSIRAEGLPRKASANWFNPRTGESSAAQGVTSGTTVSFSPPSPGDWLLLLKSLE